jgi:hypothetical protein
MATVSTEMHFTTAAIVIKFEVPLSDAVVTQVLHSCVRILDTNCTLDPL